MGNEIFQLSYAGEVLSNEVKKRMHIAVKLPDDVAQSLETKV